MNRIVLDVETQKTFEEVGGRHMHLLKVSVVGIYHYLKGKYMTFEEREIPYLEEILSLFISSLQALCTKVVPHLSYS